MNTQSITLPNDKLHKSRFLLDKYSQQWISIIMQERNVMLDHHVRDAILIINNIEEISKERETGED